MSLTDDEAEIDEAFRTAPHPPRLLYLRDGGWMLSFYCVTYWAFVISRDPALIPPSAAVARAN